VVGEKEMTKLINEAIEQIHKDTWHKSNFMSCTSNLTYKLIALLGKNIDITENLIANIDKHPWICICLLEETQETNPYNEKEPRSWKLHQLIEAWKQWYIKQTTNKNYT